MANICFGPISQAHTTPTKSLYTFEYLLLTKFLNFNKLPFETWDIGVKTDFGKKLA